jgi:hypothetical protein
LGGGGEEWLEVLHKIGLGPEQGDIAFKDLEFSRKEDDIMMEGYRQGVNVSYVKE